MVGGMVGGVGGVGVGVGEGMVGWLGFFFFGGVWRGWFDFRFGSFLFFFLGCPGWGYG